MPSYRSFKSREWPELTLSGRQLIIKEGLTGEKMFGSREDWKT
jgi:hypothetical protein